LTNSNLKFKKISKDRLFFNKFQYGISFELDEVNAITSLDHEEIDDIIERRIAWREVSIQRWNNGGKNTIMSRRWKDITGDTLQNLHDLCDILLNTSSKHKLVTSAGDAWVYTNDLEFIKQLGDLKMLGNKKYREAVIDRPQNTVLLKNPKHQHRSYFAAVKLSSEEKTQLHNFLNNQKETRCSPGLIDWFDLPFHRTQDYFFVDHTGQNWLLMLALVRPGLIRKTADLIAR
jgi:hypothetical protein